MTLRPSIFLAFCILCLLTNDGLANIDDIRITEGICWKEGTLLVTLHGVIVYPEVDLINQWVCGDVEVADLAISTVTDPSNECTHGNVHRLIVWIRWLLLPSVLTRF
jgi:hypothetical protein